MPLESLLLRNFQKHKRFKIEFDPHVTCIVGPNDQGKSAILRALYWLALNKPSGQDFRTWESKKTLVRLKVDGHIIRRQRSSENSYSLDGEVYKAFGQNVPASIADLLNINPSNFQIQDSPAFWISNSPAEVARHLNSIVNLDIIDHAFHNITTESRRARIALEISNNRITQAREKRRNLRWVTNFNATVIRLESKEKQIEDLKEKQENLEKIIREFNHYNKIAINAKPALQKGKILLELCEKIQAKQQSMNKLKRLIDDFQEIERNSCRIKERLTILHGTLRAVSTCPMCGQPIKQSNQT